MKFTEKLFGTHSERELKRIYPIVDKIEALRPTMQALTDEELRAKTKEYKDRYNGFHSPGSIRNRPRGSKTFPRYGTPPRTADRWYYPPSGPYR